MKTKQIEKIANKVAEKYLSEKPIITKCKTDKEWGAKTYIEIRCELPSYEGGNEMINEIQDKLGYYVENMSGCVYNVLQD